MASVAKARLIFMTFRELRLTRTLNWRNAFSYLRVRKLFLPAWEYGRRLFIKDFRVHCVHQDLWNCATCRVLTRFRRLTE